jgi:hypothetical protein
MDRYILYGPPILCRMNQARRVGSRSSNFNKYAVGSAKNQSSGDLKVFASQPLIRRKRRPRLGWLRVRRICDDDDDEVSSPSYVAS